uniref:Uncharacterized protein n=1 Tax=Tanacetum cinerariifolium TaxID=118510 RepID=A0A6L2P1A4_TANCI|nr:hypothetical protein [Tanacetum cinerariifolium]
MLTFMGLWTFYHAFIHLGNDYAVNEERSTDKIKVLNAKAEGVSAAGETLSTATLAVSTASVQPVLLCSFKNQEAKIDRLLKNVKDDKVSNEFKFIKEQIRE